MFIRELWRYPVKSLGGERLEAVDVERRGLVGDRLWAVLDRRTGELTGAKKLPALLELEARFGRPPLRGEAPRRVPPVVITFPDGEALASDDARLERRLGDFVGRAVALVPLRPARELGHYRSLQADKASLRQTFGLEPGEPLPDLSMLPAGLLAMLGLFATPPGTYFDVSPLHVLTTASLAALERAAPGLSLEARRFRPNVLVDMGAEVGLVEVGWPGATLSFGTQGSHGSRGSGGARDALRARVVCVTPRCAMPARRHLELPAEPRVSKVVASEAERCLGVYASPLAEGRLGVGDALRVIPEPALARALRPAQRLAKRRALRLLERLLPGP
jgi:uncharacterized protein YcbX